MAKLGLFWKDSTHLKNLIGMVMIWTSGAFGYYLIGYQLKYTKGNFFINNITSSVTEIFAYVVSCFVFKLCGINLTCFIAYTVAIAGMACLLLFLSLIHISEPTRPY